MENARPVSAGTGVEGKDTKSDVVVDTQSLAAGQAFPLPPVLPLDPLRSLPARFITWRAVAKEGGKVDKVPLDRDGKAANCNDPANWMTYDEARATGRPIGFAFNGDGFVGIDPDNCRDPVTGVWNPDAAPLFDMFPGAMMEVSQSGRGAHIIGRIDNPGDYRIDDTGKAKVSFEGTDHVDVFFANSFLAFSPYGWQGNPLVDITAAFASLMARRVTNRPGTANAPRSGEPLAPHATYDAMSDEQLIAELCLDPACNDLWNGRIPEGADRSAKDYDLICRIARYARTHERTERLFTASALHPSKRPDRKHDGTNYVVNTIRNAINAVRAQDPLTRLANVTPWTPPEMRSEPLPLPQVAAGTDEVDASEDQISRFFMRTHGIGWRYSTALGWIKFDGTRWNRSSTIESVIMESCREVVARMGGQLTPHQRNGILAHRKVAAIRKLAEASPAMIVDPKDFDADPWLLNTPGGVVDLRTGSTRPATADDRMMQMTAVAPAATEDCPTWLRFAETTWRDASVRAFMKRALGYMLTGATKEHALFLMSGRGGDGKGVTMTAIGGVMGDYAKTATPETFINTRNGQHLTFIASLAGKRLVTVAEMPDGVTWNSQRIKQISAGDETEANFMHSDSFTFRPVAKLLISCNEPPSLTSVGNDIRRRFNFIPFETVPDHLKDKELSDKLRAEWPGILRWLINGCLEWQRDGLNAPEAVRKATVDYLDDNDPIGEWLASESRIEQEAQTTNTMIFKLWEVWAKYNGYPVGTPDKLGRQLRKRRDMLAVRPGGAWRGWSGRRFKIFGTRGENPGDWYPNPV